MLSSVLQVNCRDKVQHVLIISAEHQNLALLADLNEALRSFLMFQLVFNAKGPVIKIAMMKGTELVIHNLNICQFG